jgi:hypothetical protein
LVLLVFTTPVAVGVDRIIVVTTMVLPLETERNVEGDSEGVRLGFNCGIVEEVEKDVVEDEGKPEVDEVGWASELDDGRGVELPPGELLGGGVLDGDGV